MDRGIKIRKLKWMMPGDELKLTEIP